MKKRIYSFLACFIILVSLFGNCTVSVKAAEMNNSMILFDLKKNTTIKFKTYVRGIGYRNLDAKITKFKKYETTGSGTTNGESSKSVSYEDGSGPYSRTWDTKGGTSTKDTSVSGTEDSYAEITYDEEYYLYKLVFYVKVPKNVIKKIKKKDIKGPAFCFNTVAVDYKTGENLMIDKYTLSDNYQRVYGTTITQKWTAYNPVVNTSEEVACYKKYFCEMTIYRPKSYKRMCLGIVGSKKPGADGSYDTYETADIGTENNATVLYTGIHKGKNASFWDGYNTFLDTTYYSNTRYLSHFMRIK